MPTAVVIGADALCRNTLRLALERVGVMTCTYGSASEAEVDRPLHEHDVIAIDATGRAEETLRTLRRLRGRVWRGSILYLSDRCTDAELDEVTRQLRVRAVFYKPLSLDELALRLPRLIPGTSSTPMMDALVPKTWTGALEHVRQEYRARLPQDVAKLEHAVHAARARPESELLRVALDQAHALFGSAGTFRFDLVSECAAAIEQELLLLCSGATPLTDRDAWRRIVQLAELARLGAPPSPHAAEAPSPASRQAAPSEDGCVLVVSDDVALMMRLAAHASGNALTLVSARNLAEAEQAASECRLDAALLDEHLPEDVAQTVLHAIRRRPLHRDLPFNWIAPAPQEPTRRVHRDAARTLPRQVDAPRFLQHVSELIRSRSVRPWRILIVDDDIAFARAVTAMFASYRVEVHHLPAAVGLSEHLDRVRPDLMIVDLLMPYVSGYDVCRDVRKHPRWAGLPILVVTAQGSQLVRLSTFRAGADDFVLKPVVGEELIARVFAHIDRVRRTLDRDHSGALRRHAFLDAAGPIVAFEDERGEPTTAVIVHIEGLHEVNTRHGLTVGDDMLRAVRESLATWVPRGAPIGRWGGTRFSAVLPGRNATASAVEIDAWLKRLASTPLHAPDGTAVHLTVRAGWMSTDRTGPHAEALLNGAEAHLRRASEPSTSA